MQLIISETNPVRLAEWYSAFTGLGRVAVMRIDPLALHRMETLDAELMPGVLVHERYGGIERRWESLVLPTGGDKDMPPYVVTTPAFPAHFERRKGADGTVERIVVPDVEMTPQEETYTIFRHMFTAINRFNAQHEVAPIRLVGVSTDIMALWKDAATHAAAVRRAYLAEFGSKGVHCQDSE